MVVLVLKAYPTISVTSTPYHLTPYMSARSRMAHGPRPRQYLTYTYMLQRKPNYVAWSNVEIFTILDVTTCSV